MLLVHLELALWVEERWAKNRKRRWATRKKVKKGEDEERMWDGKWTCAIGLVGCVVGTYDKNLITAGFLDIRV